MWIANKKYDEACCFYQLASALDSENPLIYKESIQEFFKINELDSAKILYANAANAIKNHQGVTSFKELISFINDPYLVSLKN